MEFTHHALIGAPPGRVFDFLSDIEHVAACLPGAHVTEHLGGRRYAGIVRVKLTAVHVTLTGDLEWLADPARCEVTLVGRGRDSRRGNTATGRIAVAVESSEQGGAFLTFDSRIDVAGRLAQLGAGLIADIAARIIEDFAQRVEASLTGRSVAAIPGYLDVGSATADVVRERAGRFLRGFGRGRP